MRQVFILIYRRAAGDTSCKTRVHFVRRFRQRVKDVVRYCRRKSRRQTHVKSNKYRKHLFYYWVEERIVMVRGLCLGCQVHQG